MSEEATLDETAEEISESPDVVPWSQMPLGEVANIINGNAFSSDEYTDDGIPLIRISNIGPGTTSDENLKYLPSEFLNQVDGKFTLEKDDILMAMSGATTGKVSRLPSRHAPALLNQRIARFETSNELNRNFLLFCLQSHDFQRYVDAFASGGAQDNISAYDLEKISIPFPSLEEQRKIATVLHTVDQAIQKTEEIAEQVEKTKQALMKSLFSQGYFDYDETAGAYHRNRLTRHPGGWQTKPASEVMDVTRGAHPRPKSDDSLWRGEIPIIKISDRNRGDSRTITSTKETVTEKGSKKSKLIDAGTLIVSNAGTVGEARITGMQACIHDHWLILRNYAEDLSARYLYYFINWNQNFLEALSSGSTVLDLNTDDFRLFDVTFPCLEEQEKIVDSLDNLHDQKMINIEYSNRLQHLKQGLMQDILSGEVRTTDADIDIPEEVAKYG